VQMKGNPPRPRIFLSYAHEDRELVERLVRSLQASGLHAYVDRYELLAGECILEEIELQIAGAQVFLVALSKSAMRSRWVRAEIDLMFARTMSSSATIVPVMLEECRVPAMLATRKVVRCDQDFEAGVVEILSAIRDWVARERHASLLDVMRTRQESRPGRADSGARAAVARYAMLTGHLDDAETLLREAVAERGNDWDARQLLAATLMKAGRTEEARKILLQLLRLGVQKARSHYNLACLYSIRASLRPSPEAYKRTRDLENCYRHLRTAIATRFVWWLATFGCRIDPIGDILTDPDLQYAIHESEGVAGVMRELATKRTQSTDKRQVYGGGGGCFAPDTLVLAADGGSVQISAVQCGDHVASVDGEGRKTLCEVVERIRNWADAGVTINGELTVSAHQMLLTDHGWQRASRLALGAKLATCGGGYVEARRIKPWSGQRVLWQLGLAPQPVFVAQGLLVHNAKCILLY